MKMMIAVLGASVVFAGTVNALAGRCENQSIYRGGGFMVSIGNDGSYYGCNRNNECTSIADTASVERGTWIWEKGGYSYAMIGEDNGYRLKVTAPSGKVLVNQTMVPDDTCR